MISKMGLNFNVKLSVVNIFCTFVGGLCNRHMRFNCVELASSVGKRGCSAANGV